MIQAWIHRIKPGMEPRLRSGLEELGSRTVELRESLSRSGVCAEQAFVLSGVTHSPSPVEHQQVLADCVEHTLTEPPAYDTAI